MARTKKHSKKEPEQKRLDWPLVCVDWLGCDHYALKAHDHEDDPSMPRFEAVIFR